MTDDPEAFKSEKFDRLGEFRLSLSQGDYMIVMHALMLGGNIVAERRGEKASRPYDELHDRLMDWNHCDEEPYDEEG
jgi:hypothetical protein